MSTAEYTAVLLLSLMSCFTTCIGVLLAIWLRENTEAIAAGIGFSTGIMLLISLLELIPESYADIGFRDTLLTTVLGAGLVWAAHFIIPHTHLVEETRDTDPRLIRSVYLVVFGLVLHDVPEGFAMANAYVASPSLGILVGLAIALHNIPEEFAMAVPAITLKSKRFLFGAALFSALAEPLGALVGLVAVNILPSLNSFFMAFAAGAMIFVSIHELVPMARRYHHMGLFLGGMVFSVLVYQLLVMMTTASG